MASCKIMFDMRRQTPEFIAGVMAALDWFDGVPQGDETISLEFSDRNHAMLSMNDGGSNDNRTFRVKKGKFKFESLGVEL